MQTLKTGATFSVDAPECVMADDYPELFFADTRIQDAKRPETRAGRIEKFVDMLSRGETLY